MYKHMALLVLSIFAILSVPIVEAKDHFTTGDIDRWETEQKNREAYCKSNDFKEFLKNNPKIKITEEDCLRQAKKVFVSRYINNSRIVTDEDIDASYGNLYDEAKGITRIKAIGTVAEAGEQGVRIVEKVIPGPGVSGGLIKKAIGEVVKELPGLLTPSLGEENKSKLETISSPMTHRLSLGANFYTEKNENAGEILAAVKDDINKRFNADQLGALGGVINNQKINVVYNLDLSSDNKVNLGLEIKNRQITTLGFGGIENAGIEMNVKESALKKIEESEDKIGALKAALIRRDITYKGITAQNQIGVFFANLGVKALLKLTTVEYKVVNKPTPIVLYGKKATLYSTPAKVRYVVYSPAKPINFITNYGGVQGYGAPGYSYMSSYNPNKYSRSAGIYSPRTYNVNQNLYSSIKTYKQPNYVVMAGGFSAGSSIFVRRGRS